MDPWHSTYPFRGDTHLDGAPEDHPPKGSYWTSSHWIPSVASSAARDATDWAAVRYAVKITSPGRDVAFSRAVVIFCPASQSATVAPSHSPTYDGLASATGAPAGWSMTAPLTDRTTLTTWGLT